MDREGNKINEEGFYDITEEYVNDLLIKPKKTRRRTAKKEEVPEATPEESPEPATES